MRIYNTLSKKKDLIKPLKGKNINLFVCGPTVYDFSHIGHARTFVIFDSFAKYLRKRGYKVFYLQNITDIDDKIIARAREKKVPVKDLAKTFEQEYLKDMKAIAVNGVDKYARATDYIKEIISQVKRILDKGFAYELEDGIYFNIGKFKNYGKLSGRTAVKAEDTVSRIDYSKNKKNRGDFCLWKKTLSGSEDEPAWNSPFGKGRPGWHIEDTAITEKFFGARYDIHGGALDLLFPHHEAEIAQMESLSGKKLANYWMHSGLLNIQSQKMAKSLSNFIMIRDFLIRHSYRKLRFWVLKNLWRSPADYSESAMIEVKSSLEKIEEFLRKLKTTPNKNQRFSTGQATQKLKLIKNFFKKAEGDFYEALDDDFNTPKALASLFGLINRVNSLLDKGQVGKKEAGGIYDFFVGINEIFDIIDFTQVKKTILGKEIKKLVKERETSRKNKDWQKSDELREKIERKGYSISDTESGPVLKKI